MHLREERKKNTSQASQLLLQSQSGTVHSSASIEVIISPERYLLLDIGPFNDFYTLCTFMVH